MKNRGTKKRPKIITIDLTLETTKKKESFVLKDVPVLN